MKNILSLCRVPLVMVSVALLLAGCIPESKHPLPPPADGKGDDRLIGRWDPSEENEKGYIEIEAVGGGRYRVRMFSLEGDGPDAGKANEEEMDVLTTRIGGQWFMSVTDFAEQEKRNVNEPGYLILRYDISAQGELLIHTMSREAVIADVHAGKVVGETDSAKMEGDIILTADSEALAAYIAAADPKLLFTGTLDPLRRH